MWRLTKSLARRAIISSYNGSARFRSIQGPSQVLHSQYQALNMDSDESQYLRNSCSHVTTWACSKSPFNNISRFFSSNPTVENEELHTEDPFSETNESYSSNASFGSTFDFDENRSFSFSESPVSEANAEKFDSGGVSFDLRSDFDESPSTISTEFEDWNKDIDNLALNNVGFASGKENDEQVMIEGEKDVENTAEYREKLESLLSLLQSSGTFSSLDSSLEDMDLAVNEELVVRVLETPLIMGENLIGFFKWVLKKREFPMTTKVVDLIVRAISRDVRTRDAYALWDLVKEVGQKEIGVLTTEILNELISLFSKLGKGKAAFEVFNKFEEFQCVPDADAYYWTIDALCRRSFFDWACSVCEKMLNADKLPDSEKVGKIISHLCRGKKLKDAHAIYMWAKESKKHPPQSSVNFLISSLSHKEKTEAEEKKNQKGKTGSCAEVEEDVSAEEKENVHLALEMLDDIPGEERKHSNKPFSFVTKGLCRIKDVQGAKKLLFKMIEAGPPPGYTIFNTVITAFSRAGDMKEAVDMIKIMEDRGLKPDVYTYAVIMSGYVDGGSMEEASKILDESKEKHLKLSPIIYYTLIRGYCKLEQFDMARKLLGEMKDYGVQPHTDEYNKLIKALCLKTLDWRTAEKLQEEMQENGLHLNEITKSLIRAVKELEEEKLASQAIIAAA